MIIKFTIVHSYCPSEILYANLDIPRWTKRGKVLVSYMVLVQKSIVENKP